MLINFSRLKSALFTGFSCGMFCVSTLVLQTTVSNSVVGQDASQKADAAGATAAQQQQAQKQEERKKQVGESLYKELESLVPGDQTEGSAAAEALHAAVDSFVQGKPKISLVVLEQAVASNPGFPPAELLMAGLYLAAQDQNNGLQYLHKAAVKNLEHPAIYAAYGRLAVATNRDIDAMVNFEKLLSTLDKAQLDETAVTHYENEYLGGMSRVSVKLENYDQARDLIGKLLQRKPDNTESLQLLARVSFEEGKIDEAMTNLKKLREKKPGTRVPEAVIGTWFARAGKPDEAAAWIKKLPDAYPQDATVQAEYAAWVLQKENIDAAAAAIARAEAIGPATPASDNIKGKIAFYQRKYDEAVAIYKALYEANPNNPEIANMYVLSLIESSSEENHAIASALANSNAKRSPNNRVVLATLGYVRLRKVGVNDQLKQLFAKVAQTRDGRSPEVDFFLANFLREVNDDKTALVVLQQASQYPGLFLYRKQADQMRQALAATAGVLPTP